MQPGGYAILTVPIEREITYEDPSLQSPEERLRAFGQTDHVRVYDKDIANRIRGAGFSVEVFSPQVILSEEEVASYGLDTKATGVIFHCKKR